MVLNGELELMAEETVMANFNLLSQFAAGGKTIKSSIIWSS
jgi:hypothetical protein